MLAGVLVAVGIGSLVGLTWWSLGAVVALSIAIGRALRLGPHLMEVPISAMLVLAVSSDAEALAIDRVYETLIGTAVGILVNLLIAPPLYVQPAEDAIAELADRIAGFLRSLAGQLREGWSRQAADHWLAEARTLAAEVERADATLDRAEQSAVLNPRGGLARRVQPRLRVALGGLEHAYISLRGLCRGLLDRTFYLPAEQEADAYGPEARGALADVLDTTADAVWEIGEVAAGTMRTESARPRVERLLDELLRRRDRLASMLLVDPAADPAAWEQHGAVLAAVDRFRVEVASAVRPPEQEWRPPRVSDRQRQAVRRVVAERAQSFRERRARRRGGG